MKSADGGSGAEADGGDEAREVRGSRRRVRLWWSTGKDATWTLRALRADPEIVVDALVTTVTSAFDRVSIHGTRLEILEAQAASVGLPLRTIELPWPCSNAQYEAAVRVELREAVRDGVDAYASGDLHLEDVRDYRERLLEGTGLEAIFPIWGLDTGRLAREMVDAGVEARVTCLDPERLDRSLAGARYDTSFLDALPGDVDACGENGEFHTCVVAGPMMAAPLDVEVGDVVEREGFVYADLAPKLARHSPLT